MTWKFRDWSAMAWLLTTLLSTAIVYRSSLRFFFSQDDFVLHSRRMSLLYFPGEGP